MCTNNVKVVTCQELEDLDLLSEDPEELALVVSASHSTGYTFSSNSAENPHFLKEERTHENGVLSLQKETKDNGSNNLKQK